MVEANFVHLNTTMQFGETYDFANNRMHVFFFEDGAKVESFVQLPSDQDGDGDVDEADIAKSGAKRYRLTKAGCQVYPESYETSAEQATNILHSRSPTNIIATVDPEFLGWATVKGIPCTQFKYSSTSDSYDDQGHQLVGEAEEELPSSGADKVDTATFELIVSFSMATDIRGEFPVSAVMTASIPAVPASKTKPAQPAKTLTEIYTWTAFRPWVDESFTGFDLARYSNCTVNKAPYKANPRVIAPKPIEPLPTGKDKKGLPLLPPVPKMPAQYSAVVEARPIAPVLSADDPNWAPEQPAYDTQSPDTAAVLYSVASYDVYDFTGDGQQASHLLVNTTNVNDADPQSPASRTRETFWNWERGVHLSVSNVVNTVDGTDDDGNPTSKVSIDKVCSAYRMTEETIDVDGNLEVLHSSKILKWPGTNPTFVERTTTRGIVVDRWRTKADVLLGNGLSGSYDLVWDFSAPGWSFRGAPAAGQVPLKVVASGRYGLVGQPESAVPFARTYEFFWVEPAVRREDLVPAGGLTNCTGFQMIGTATLSAGRKKTGDVKISDVELVVGASFELVARGYVQRLPKPNQAYKFAIVGSAALDDLLFSKSPAKPLADVYKFKPGKDAAARITFNVSLGNWRTTNITLWGPNSIIGRSLVVMEDKAGGAVVAQAPIGIKPVDLPDVNFAQGPRKALSIEASGAILRPVQWAEAGALANETTPTADVSFTQTDREQLKMTLAGEGFEAGQEYSFAIREYGDLNKPGEVGGVFNPTKWVRPVNYAGPDPFGDDGAGLPYEIGGLVADKKGKLTLQGGSLTTNFTLNGWKSIIGRACTITHVKSGKRITGVIGVTEYDPNAGSDADFFSRLKNKLNNLDAGSKFGGGAAVIVILLAIVGGVVVFILRKRRAHATAVAGGGNVEMGAPGAAAPAADGAAKA